ncbi:GNAT family N-acetyltransferase [Halocatena pleomorpha]|uniref:GNAT family N-acetyltransferase n=2 Tax=Halocatena pleomorpha TaxID=1785090 RepID=A0A3P3REL9_9EURY|nr:GNAT family N-acetyltransferase [Halocatena pleomorpha]
MTIRELQTNEEYEEAVRILEQLWTDAEDEFIRSWADEAGYRLFGLYENETLLAVANCSVQRVLHHQRHAWIHDLVVDETHRSAGYGTRLLSFVEQWARDHDCAYVALAGTLDNEMAHQFYESNGMNRWGYVFEREIDT